MSSGAAHRELLSFLLRQEPGPVAERDLIAALEAGRVGPFDFLYAACIEAGCSPDIARARTAGSYACFAAGNVADDLADGDCDYLDRSHQTGPAVEFILLHAAYALWLGPGHVTAGVAADAAKMLVRGAAQQLVEVRTTRFTLETSRDIALGMGGHQYAAYLRVAWTGTALEDRAREVGLAIGSAGLVAEDRRSEDRRFTDLVPVDRAQLLTYARAELDRARVLDLPCMAAVIRYIAPLLEPES